MPSPFPGMDPYLESPHIWPDFHHALAGEIRAALNHLLPKPYYAQLEMRPEVGIIDVDERGRNVEPDVTIVERTDLARAGYGAVAVLGAARTEASEYVEVRLASEPVRHHFVEIRDAANERKLVTLIEIVSPSNKRAGKDRKAYLAKQNEVLSSDASLIELDLLRGGARLADPQVRGWLRRQSPPTDYVVTVTRAWGRERCRLYPVQLRQVLPVISVPLRQQDAEVPLDLQYVVNRAYEGGPYLRGAIDYENPPVPPLREEDAAWAAERIRRAFAS